jgi:hypothetical protein
MLYATGGQPSSRRNTIFVPTRVAGRPALAAAEGDGPGVAMRVGFAAGLVASAGRLGAFPAQAEAMTARMAMNHMGVGRSRIGRDSMIALLPMISEQP